MFLNYFSLNLRCSGAVGGSAVYLSHLETGAKFGFSIQNLVLLRCARESCLVCEVRISGKF